MVRMLLYLVVRNVLRRKPFDVCISIFPSLPWSIVCPIGYHCWILKSEEYFAVTEPQSHAKLMFSESDILYIYLLTASRIHSIIVCEGTGQLLQYLTTITVTIRKPILVSDFLTQGVTVSGNILKTLKYSNKENIPDNGYWL